MSEPGAAWRMAGYTKTNRGGGGGCGRRRKRRKEKLGRLGNPLQKTDREMVKKKSGREKLEGWKWSV